MPLRVSDFHFPLSTFQLPFSNFQFPTSIFQFPTSKADGIYRLGIWPTDNAWCVRYLQACDRPTVRGVVLLRHNFSSTDSISNKKLYFISAFSIDLYTARRYIGQLNNYSINYKSRLEALKLLPLMYLFEINDIIFLSNL